MDNIPNLGMFAAVHREEQIRQPQQRRPRPVHENSSSSVISSPNGGVLPGAYAEGGRRGQATDDYTVSQEQSAAPSPLESHAQIPIASEAVPVAPVVHAEATEPKAEGEEEAREEPKWLSQRRNQYILLLILLLAAGIVVAVVLLVSGGENEGQGSTELENAPSGRQSDDDVGSEMVTETTPTPSSSPSISSAPTSFFDRIFELLSSYSGKAVLQDSSTPQYQAFQWTLGDADGGDWSDDVILQRYALASLFYSTAGLRWLSVTDFLLQVSYCNWDGVGCTNDTLTSLSLPSENLAGTVPREIGILTSLTSLDVSGNPLTGSLPVEIGLLTKLEVLDVSSTQDSNAEVTNRPLRRRGLEDALPQSTLSGPIPSEVGLLTSLLTLDLSGNVLSGSIPSEVGQLEGIRNLFMNGNLLGEAIPLQLGFLTALQRLSLEKNLLTGGVPNALCSSLTVIEELSSDCLAEIDGDKPSEVVCKCCNVCCDVNDVCRNLDVTAFPSSTPSTSLPSTLPSSAPTSTPSNTPSLVPSSAPSSSPSNMPSFVPSMTPSSNPTPSGTPQPTVTASQSPSNNPTLIPSSSPSLRPTSIPTITQSIPPTVSCRIDENSCLGNRACNGAVELCTESGSCSGRNACRSVSDLSVAQGSCVGMLITTSPCSSHETCLPFTNHDSF